MADPFKKMTGCLVAAFVLAAIWAPAPASAAAGEEGGGSQYSNCAGDADCDGLKDSEEDANGNGAVDADETDPKNPDSDGDGLTDGEERLHIGRVETILSGEDVRIRFPERLDPLKVDSDGDCLTDGVELGVGQDEIKILIDRMPKKPHYQLSPRCNAILDANLVSELSNAISHNDSPAGLYNIAALYDADPNSITDPTSDDSDDDGVIDGLEDFNFNGMRDSETPAGDENSIDSEPVWLEMDPGNPDSDGDGLRDGEEGDRDGDGQISAEDESSPIRRDTDGDGISDGEEVRAGTRVNVCDTDGDGLSDGVELGRIQPDEYNGCHGLQASGTNYAKPGAMDPKNPDSDGDGLKDGDEDKSGNGWVDPDESDPSAEDTDGDGLSDGIETLGDFDGDGFPDFDFKLIHGESGCRTPEELIDVDCDGVSNARDDDSDGDGCSDKDEGGWVDADANNVPDVYDPQAKACPEESSQGGGSQPAKKPEEVPPAAASTLFPDGNDGTACTLIKSGAPAPGAAFIIALILLCTISCLLSFRTNRS